MRRTLWRRTEVWALLGASLLFLAGALNLLTRNRRAEERSTVTTSASPTFTSPAGPTSIGPSPGEQVGAYIERKKGVLRSRAAEAPAKTSYAVISFGDFLSAADVQVVASAAEAKVSELQLRAPHPGRQRWEVPAPDGVEAAAGKAHDQLVRETEQEIRDLEELIPTVDDSSFKRVYREDLEAEKDLLGALRSNPPMVFAIVVRSTHSLLEKTQAMERVRLVDVPEDPKISPSDQAFPGLLPEQT